MLERIPRLAVAFAFLALLSFAQTTAFAPLPTALALLALPAFFLRGTVPLSRTVLLPTTLVMALVIFTNLSDLRRASPMAALPAAYPAGLLLGALLVACLYRRCDAREGLAVPVLSTLVLVDAGVTTEPFPFFLGAGAAVAAMALAFRSWIPGTRRGGPPGIDRPAVVSALLLVPAFALALALVFVLRGSETTVNQLLRVIDPTLGSGVTFQANTSLGSLVDMRSDRVVARLFSTAPPQYLFARAYCHYKEHGSMWEGLAYQAQAEIDRARLPGLALPPQGHVFALTSGPVDLLAGFRPAQVDTVDLTVTCGNVLAPRDAVLAGLPTAALGRDAAGGCLPFPAGQGLPPGRFWIARGPAPAAPPGPAPADPRSPTPAAAPSPAPADPRSPASPGESREHLDACLQIPEAVAAYARPLAEQVTAGSPTPEARAAAMRDWFHSSFEYSLAWRRRAPDPLKEFLQEKTPSHCEFFASGMTLMLRSIGIPARYVTGFMVVEENRPGGYHVIRDEHAHAWVEAWLEGRGWVTYDPTPPRALQAPPRSTLSQIMDWALYHGTRLKAMFKSFAWRELGQAILDGIQALGRWLIEQPWRIAVLLGLFFWEALFRRGSSPFRRWWRRRHPVADGGSLDPDDVRMRAALDRFDAWTARWGRPRPPHLTLLEWARELAPPAGDPRVGCPGASPAASAPAPIAGPPGGSPPGPATHSPADLHLTSHLEPTATSHASAPHPSHAGPPALSPGAAPAGTSGGSPGALPATGPGVPLPAEAREGAEAFLHAFSTARYSSARVSPDDLAHLEHLLGTLERNPAPAGRGRERPPR